jgi:hypothetical protein
LFLLLLLLLLLLGLLCELRKLGKKSPIPYIMTEHVSTMPTRPSSCVFFFNYDTFDVKKWQNVRVIKKRACWSRDQLKNNGTN